MNIYSTPAMILLLVLSLVDIILLLRYSVFHFKTYGNTRMFEPIMVTFILCGVAFYMASYFAH